MNIRATSRTPEQQMPVLKVLPRRHSDQECQDRTEDSFEHLETRDLGVFDEPESGSSPSDSINAASPLRRRIEKAAPAPDAERQAATDCAPASIDGIDSPEFGLSEAAGEQLFEGPLPGIQILPSGPLSTQIAAAQAHSLEQYSASLELQVEEMYDIVTRTMSNQIDVGERALRLVSEAHDRIILGTRSDLKEAEYKLQQARLLANRVSQSRRWANSWAWLILAYEVAAFVVFVAGIILQHLIPRWIGIPGAAAANLSMNDVFPAWNTMLWGGIGGVVGAFYSLHWHVSDMQDFDKNHNLWYVVAPLMGLVLGGFTQLLSWTFIVALLPDAAQRTIGSVALSWLPALAAVMAGFRQRFVFEFLDRFLAALGREPGKQ